jgi:hypothetical protein
MVNPPTPFTHQKGMLLYHTLLLFRYANRDLDKPTFSYFRTVALLAQAWLSQTLVAILASLSMTPCSLGEAKPRVGSDWLVSSSKLQPCLALCRFAQAPLKIKVAR